MSLISGVLGGMSLIGGVLGGKSKSTTTPILSEEQKKLINQQLQLGEFQLEELKRQREVQGGLFDASGEAAKAFDESLSQFTGAATDEQKALIDEAVTRALESGESDIRRFQSEATEQLRNELAPQLGLLPGDTPILDRGGRIAAESVRQQGQLVSKLGLGKATSELEFPLAVQDFQARLKQNAFLNRLQLAQTKGSLGLNLAGVSAPQAGAVLANQGSFTKGSNPAQGLSSGLGGIGGLLTGIGDIR